MSRIVIVILIHHRHKSRDLIRQIVPRHTAEDINLHSYHPERLKFHRIMELRFPYNAGYCSLLKIILRNTDRRLLEGVRTELRRPRAGNCGLLMKTILLGYITN
jgi:hypothetical protein